MSEHKDGVVLHDREFVPNPEVWADYLCSDCGECRGRRPVGELCYACFDNRHRMLKALGIGIAAAAECEIEAERCGWDRRNCLRCGRTMPEVQLRSDYDGYECTDYEDCWREIDAAREQAEQERRKKAKEQR